MNEDQVFDYQLLKGQPLTRFLQELEECKGYEVRGRNQAIYQQYMELTPAQKTIVNAEIRTMAKGFFKLLADEFRAENVDTLDCGTTRKEFALFALPQNNPNPEQSVLARFFNLSYNPADGCLDNPETSPQKKMAYNVFMQSDPYAYMSMLFTKYLGYQEVGEAYFPCIGLFASYYHYTQLKPNTPVTQYVEDYVRAASRPLYAADEKRFSHKIIAYILLAKIAGEAEPLAVIPDTIELVCKKRPTLKDFTEVDKMMPTILKEAGLPKDFDEAKVMGAFKKAAKDRWGEAMFAKVDKQFNTRIAETSKHLKLIIPDGK